MVQRTLETLEQTLKHRFRDRALLERAVTHSSLAFERHAGLQTTACHSDNEKLEFLGDAVCGLARRAVALRILSRSRGRRSHPSACRARQPQASWQCRRVAASGCPPPPRPRRRAQRSRRKTVLLTNSFEAVLAALYLDAGTRRRPCLSSSVPLIEPTAPRLYQGLGARRERGRSQVRITGDAAGQGRGPSGIRGQRRNRSGPPQALPGRGRHSCVAATSSGHGAGHRNHQEARRAGSRAGGLPTTDEPSASPPEEQPASSNVKSVTA